MRTQTMLHAAALCLAAIPLAHAEPARVRPVDDSLLATMRGRGIPGETITGFQLVVVSTWSGGPGAAAATGTVRVRGLGTARPQVQTDSMAGGSGMITGGGAGSTGGTLRVQGVSQLTQVAGDGNQGHNSFELRLVPDGTTMPAMSNGPFDASYDGAGGTQARVNADGRGGITVAITTAAGQALQAFGGGGVVQSLAIRGNAQTVANNAVLTVLTRPSGAMAGVALLRQLQNMMPNHP